MADAFCIIGDIGIAADGVLDGAAGYGKVDHVHGFEIVHHGVDQAAGKGITAAYTVQNIEGEHLALKGVALVPHECFQAVLAAAVGVAHMAGDAFDVGVAFHEGLEDIILLFVAGAERDVIL